MNILQINEIWICYGLGPGSPNLIQIPKSKSDIVSTCFLNTARSVNL